MNNKHLMILMIFVSIGTSLILYSNTIKGSFVYDDKLFNREELKSSGNLTQIWSEPYLPKNASIGIYRPATIFSFALNFITFGDSPISFRITNIILNGIVVFLVFLLVLNLFKNGRLAIISSLFYAFLPIHTEAISLIKSRDEILFALFILLAWLLFIKATENKINYWQLILSPVFYLLGLLSKEMAIIAPVIFILVYKIQHQSSLKEIIKISMPFFWTASIYLGIRQKVLGEYMFGKTDNYFAHNPLAYADFWTRLWTPLKIVFIYIGKTFFPYNLSATYDFNHVPLVSNPAHSIQAILGFFLLGALLLCVLLRKVRAQAIGIGALVFLVSYFMISGFVFQSADMIAEHWIYFPSIGLSIVAAYFLDILFKSHERLGSMVFAAILIIYASTIIPRNRVWLSEINLYQSMIKSAPNSVQGYLSLTSLYFNEGKIEDAKREIAIASSIYKDDYRVLDSIGAIAMKEKNYSLAESSLIKALKIYPNINTRLLDLSKEYYTAKNYEKALETTETYMKLTGRKIGLNRVPVYVFSLTRLGFFQQSLDVIFNYSLEKNPDFFPIIARNYYRLGHKEKAFQYLGDNLTEEQKTKLLESF